MSGINSQTEGFEVPVKRKTWDIVEYMNNHNIRDSVTERDTLVFEEFFENLFCCSSYRIVIIHNKQGRLNILKKLNSKIITYPISQQSDSFADDIPSCIERKLMLLAIFEKFYSFFIVGIVRV